MFKRSSPLESIQTQLANLSSSLKTVSDNIYRTRNAFLKWSYDPEETNLCLTHVFSCFVDLDFAYEELTKQLQSKNAEYRQSFSSIIEKEAELERIKTRTAAEVRRLNQKIDRLTNEKKKEKEKKKGKSKKINVHEEMSRIVQQIQDAANKLKEKEDNFESFKAKSLRESGIIYSRECSAIQSKINLVFQTREEVSKLMSDEPTLEKENLPDGNILVQKLFKKIDMDLPNRKAQFDRQQIEKASTTNRDVLSRLSVYHDIGQGTDSPVDNKVDDYPNTPSQTETPYRGREPSVKKNKQDCHDTDADGYQVAKKTSVGSVDEKGYLTFDGSSQVSRETEDDYLVAKTDSDYLVAKTSTSHSSVDQSDSSSDNQEGEYENAADELYQELDEAIDDEEEYSYPTVMIGSSIPPGLSRHDSTGSKHEEATDGNGEYLNLSANTKAKHQYINSSKHRQQKKSVQPTLSAPSSPRIPAKYSMPPRPSTPELRPRNASLQSPELQPRTASPGPELQQKTASLNMGPEIQPRTASLAKTQPRAPTPPNRLGQNFIDELKSRNK